MKRICFVYHSFDEDDKFMNVKFSEFKKQIEYLKKKKYNFCHIEEILKAKKGNNVCIMFDDGLSSIKKAVLYLEKEKIKYSIGIVNSINELDIDFKKLKYCDILFHTNNHKSLVTLNGIELEKEITNNISYINPNVIIYPMGLYNDTVLKCVSNKGYLIGLTVLPFHISKNNKLLEIPRICINGYLSMNKYKLFTTKIGNLYLHIAFLKRKMLRQNYLDK